MFKIQAPPVQAKHYAYQYPYQQCSKYFLWSYKNITRANDALGFVQNFTFLTQNDKSVIYVKFQNNLVMLLKIKNYEQELWLAGKKNMAQSMIPKIIIDIFYQHLQWKHDRLQYMQMCLWIFLAIAISFYKHF